ncbi:hypothetical protein MTER_00890 [Mycolicibacter terrae]|uniref:Transmembrane protein n=1 Tax=Mycolicibacter terrae TaxID=1788 RepID=A0AAD1HSK6_9MYCO|nr:hypothetical protein [Mycolicibacter terrae]ORW95051.1 hypothetical protein AWC28_11600 [Mycolicibacter terrae]BBX20678.1 hypothetical protein MTER_00890 [Mycolicibacter terrae]SNV94364.1 transmembrane protein [Mycolicibacter terrae]
MSRTVATVWHASLSTFAALLYFLFVLPRWWELTGFTPHVLGTVLRIILGVLVAVAALPVAATLKRSRKPEYGTPQLALTLLTGSIVAHVVAGTLIAGTAVSEIWLSLDNAGVWLFGIYGAAAAIALLGIGAFYLSFVAEMPPPPPKPIKPKTEKQPKLWRRRGKKTVTAEETEESEETEEPEDADADVDEAETTGADADDQTAESETAAEEILESAGEETADLAPAGARDKQRPSGKRRAKKSK